ncbi:MAG: transketolase C-terminal domain-containing protein [Candidatus Woesearchaeota archaeon]
MEKEVEKKENIVLITGDLGFSVFESFQNKFPNRFFNAGIAEQNMIGVAAGLSLAGKKVFVYSIIPFITFRCLEQIRNDICYQDRDVVLVGVGSGVSYGSLGFSHHAIEDVGCLKSIPNITILSPSDPNEVSALTKEAVSFKHPIYLRLGKNNEKNFNYSKSIRIGKAYYIKKGSNVALVTHGNIMEEVILAYEKLKKHGINASVISCPTIKPLDKQFFRALYRDHEKVFVIEEHNTIGGLGDSLCQLNFGKTIKIGIEDHFIYEAGSQAYLRKKEGLDSDSIVKKVIRDKE